MRLGRLFRGLFRTSGSLVLVASAVGVLVGIEYWMSPGTTRRARTASKPRRIRQSVPARPPETPARTDYFKISQTRSEIGFVYWVLQGFGKHKCFVLFDTWQEAMDDVLVRLATVTNEEPELVYASPTEFVL